MKHYKTLIAGSLSIIAVVGGLIAMSVVLEFITKQEAYDSGLKMLTIWGIFIIVAIVVIEVLKFNKKD